MHDRTAQGSPRLLELRLARLGRGGALANVGAGSISSKADRVEIQRAGLVEWYENGPEGLEQGFTLTEKPAVTVEGELVLELSLSGASAGRRGDAVVIKTDAGRNLSYGKLAVADADGRSLVARLDVPARDRVRLAVDDTDARYPIVIDPLLEGGADSELEGDQTGDFGRTVASAGDVNGDGYDDVIVVAPHYDSGQGAAFIFLGSASGIASGGPATADAKLDLATTAASAGDINGDGYDDVIISAQGAAFIFLGSASGIADGDPSTAAAQLELDVPAAAVASAGDVNGDGYDDVIVGGGSYFDDNTGQTVEGGAFIFLGSAAGIADGDPTSADTHLQTGNGGNRVASAGDVNGDGYDDVAVGNFLFLGSSLGIADGGPTSAHVQFEEPLWDVVSAGDVNGDGYGDVIAGSPYYGPYGLGAAFLFLGSSSGIADGHLAAAHLIEGDQAAGYFGWTVASAHDVNGDGYDDVIVGAWSDNGMMNRDGAAFVFLGSSSGISNTSATSAYATMRPDTPDAWMGWSVASAGDVNGDGYADVIVGVPNYAEIWQTPKGAALVFQGVADADGDRVPNDEDNCVNVPNPAPYDCDTDQDGYGNACDGDFDQDYFVFPPDYTIWLADFGDGYDTDGVGTDMDCDGYVFAPDWPPFYKQLQAGSPGPSGLDCAGTVPCP